MEKLLTCVPRAGLCNRLNAIICSLAIMRDSKFPIKIYWEKTKDCYANFGDLFQQLEWKYNGLSVEVEDLQHFYLKPAVRTNLYLPYYLRKLKGFREINNGESHTFDQILSEHTNKKLYVTSYNRFCLHNAIEMPLINIFRPIDDIKNTIDSVVNTFSDKTIGIHIRRTDNTAAIALSPMDKFRKKIEFEIECDSNVNFYLASDSESDKAYLKSLYGKRIITHDWQLSRRTLQGMKDAVSELYCLASTTKILGSSMSTYSLLASQMRGITLDLD